MKTVDGYHSVDFDVADAFLYIRSRSIYIRRKDEHHDRKRDELSKYMMKGHCGTY